MKIRRVQQRLSRTLLNLSSPARARRNKAEKDEGECECEVESGGRPADGPRYATEGDYGKAVPILHHQNDLHTAVSMDRC